MSSNISLKPVLSFNNASVFLSLFNFTNLYLKFDNGWKAFLFCTAYFILKLCKWNIISLFFIKSEIMLKLSVFHIPLWWRWMEPPHCTEGEAFFSSEYSRATRGFPDTQAQFLNCCTATLEPLPKTGFSLIFVYCFFHKETQIVLCRLIYVCITKKLRE